MEKNLARCLKGSFLSYASINFRVEWFAFFSEKYGWCNNFESNANRQQLCRLKKKFGLTFNSGKKNFCTNCHQAVITLFYFIRTADFFLLQAATTVQSLKECSHVFFSPKLKMSEGVFLPRKCSDSGSSKLHWSRRLSQRYYFSDELSRVPNFKFQSRASNRYFSASKCLKQKKQILSNTSWLKTFQISLIGNPHLRFGLSGLESSPLSLSPIPDLPSQINLRLNFLLQFSRLWRQEATPATTSSTCCAWQTGSENKSQTFG